MALLSLMRSIVLVSTLIHAALADYYVIDGHVFVLNEANFYMAIEAHDFLFVELCKYKSLFINL